jgi:cell division septation protein DedD
MGSSSKNMIKHKIIVGLSCSLALLVAGCSRQQSDWQKTRETNTADAYEQFLKKYPSGEFTAQAQARAKELYEERDWQKARDTDTPEAYQAFMKQYPEGKWTEEARIRVENFTLAQAPSGAGSGTPGASAAGDGAAAGAAAAGAVVAGAVVAGKSTSPTPPSPAAAARPTAPASVPTSGTTTANAPAATHKEAVKSASQASGPFAVQLGAFKAGSGAAKDRWEQLQQEYPTLLSGLSSKVLAKKTADGSLYRLQAIGLSEKRAHDVCVALKAKSQPCIVVPPADG